MSDETDEVFGSAPDGQTGAPSAVETAKAEAADLKDTAIDDAKHVAETAKNETEAVLDETRANAVELYHEARRELNDQAATQQQRLSSGLRSAAGDLEGMARHASSTGIAGDIVLRVAQRLEGASTWLSMRDPEGVLAEVKSFARRRPGAFIFGALAAGVVAGRLTRALASSAASGDSGREQLKTMPIAARRPTAPTSPSGAGPSGAPQEGSRGGAIPAGVEDPLYAETVSRHRDDRIEGQDERPDAL